MLVTPGMAKQGSQNGVIIAPHNNCQIAHKIVLIYLTPSTSTSTVRVLLIFAASRPPWTDCGDRSAVELAGVHGGPLLSRATTRVAEFVQQVSRLRGGRFNRMQRLARPLDATHPLDETRADPDGRRV
jgi:hypothetical protein